MTDQACCAHLRVTCETTNYIDGSRMMRWTCDACGHDLIPQRLEATPDRYPIGDVVVLASDVERRWPMTVVRHENVATVEVFWLDGDGELQSRYLPDAALRPYEVANLGFGAPRGLDAPGSMAPSQWTPGPVEGAARVKPSHELTHADFTRAAGAVHLDTNTKEQQ